MPQVTTLPHSNSQAAKPSEDETPKVRKAIITAAGRGTRFLPITKIVPKEMLPLGNLPTIHYLIKECKDSGIEEVAIVVREWGSLTEKYFEQDKQLEDYLEQKGKTDLLKTIQDPTLGLKITFVKQDPDLPYGNGAPVLSARNFFDADDFLFMQGDDLFAGRNLPLEDLSLGWFADNSLGAMLSGVEATKEEIVGKLGIFDLSKQHSSGFHYVNRFVEKPGPEDVTSNLANVGRVVLKGVIAEYLDRLVTVRDPKRELYLWDAIMMMKDNYDVGVTSLSSKWYTTGTPKLLKAAANRFADFD